MASTKVKHNGEWIYSSGLPGKTTSGLHVYSHDGSTQNEIGVSSTAASGSTDLITSGGVSQISDKLTSIAASSSDIGKFAKVAAIGEDGKVSSWSLEEGGSSTYVKSAVVTNNTVVFTDQDNNETTFTGNIGTVTSIKVNGSAKSPSSGVVDIGTVITSTTDCEKTANKVTSIDNSSTDTQYPTAKACWNMMNNVFGVVVEPNNSEFGSVSGGGVYARTRTATVTATPAENCTFIKWIYTVSRETASISATYTFAVNGNTSLTAVFTDGEVPTTVSWASGTDAEIKAMIQAASSGIITLSDYWSIGDSRTVHLTATEAESVYGIEAHTEQDVEFVLLDDVCTGFTVNGSKPNFIVGLKDGLLETGQMNTSNTNAGGWRDCKRRIWCNNQFKGSLPSTFLEIFKQFEWSQGIGGGGTSGLYTTQDYFGLAPEGCIFGSRSYSFADEAALYTQWNYYKTQSNRVKHTGTSGSAGYWWGCSPYSGSSYDFCRVNSNGGAYGNYAGSSYLLAPFGCI